METPIFEKGGVRIAVEGCGHGTLHAIYASIAKSCEAKGWNGIDLLIIGGDFQSVRNAHDLNVVAMPAKYRDMCDFHEYYSGARSAPYLTIFVGGNHEASNYLWELYYGGWVAPQMYYMGAANVVRLGPIRIAGLSGIWKGYNYNKPHHERLPYNEDDIRSIYHVREFDTRKLLQIRSQVDIGISHDWPRGMEWKGKHQQLFRFKPYFEAEAKDGTLGNVAATKVLERLRPAHWFSAHMHAKYVAVWEHDDVPSPVAHSSGNIESSQVEAKNEDEIDLDMVDDNGNGLDLHSVDQKDVINGSSGVADDVRDLLPDSFGRPAAANNASSYAKSPSLPFPSGITNKETKFLALDKCLPNRHFLQLLEVDPLAPASFERPLKLEYDEEWLAITRVFADDVPIGNDPEARVAADQGDVYYRPLIEKEMEWVENNIVKTGKLTIPEDFQQTAPVFDPSLGFPVDGQPHEYTNPHTQAFCDLLQIRNPFDASPEERAQMMQKGPRPSKPRGGGRGGRGGFGDRGRGRTRGGRGRGGFSGNSDRSRGRGRR